MKKERKSKLRMATTSCDDEFQPDREIMNASTGNTSVKGVEGHVCRHPHPPVHSDRRTSVRRSPSSMAGRRKRQASGDVAASNLLLKPGHLGSVSCAQGSEKIVQQSILSGIDSHGVTRTLEVCLRAVDTTSCQPTQPKLGRNSRKAKLKVKTVPKVTPDTTAKVPMQGTTETEPSTKIAACRMVAAATPDNLPSKELSEGSPLIPGEALDAESTSLDRSFQLDVLNLGYSHSSKDGPEVKLSCMSQGDLKTNDHQGDKKSFRIAAPFYCCLSNAAMKPGNNRKRKGQTIKRSAKRRLCSEIQTSSDQSIHNVTKSLATGLGRCATKIDGGQAVDTPQSDTRIWLSPSLQVDTLGSDPNGGIKTVYNRVIPVCLTDSSFRPTPTLSTYEDAVNTRVTYDKEGKVVVLEVSRSLSPGIYRVIYTRLATPHQCLPGSVAMETLLAHCSSLANLKPHSQYLVLGELYRVPHQRWRENLSATVVRLHLEDFLHTYNFHTFALPLLLWNGERNKWAWAKDHVSKFHAIRKVKSAPRKVADNKKTKLLPVSIAPKDTLSEGQN